MERFVDVTPGIRLWAEQIGPEIAADAVAPDPVLLIMGANASGLAWPDALVSRLAEQHPVIRYDHRDTGRSAWAFDRHPYSVADLAEDAIAVLDAFDVERAHVVGMSMGGILVQLLLLDHPDRLLTATLLCTSALDAGLAGAAPDLPGPDPALLRLWQEMDDPRDAEREIDWRVEHWRLLNGTGTPFDPAEFRALEERIIEHTGWYDSPSAHAHADPGGLDRGAELATVDVPTLVIEAPEDPVNPPPHSGHLARAIGGARMVRVPGMGHALNATVVEPVAAAILSHAARGGEHVVSSADERV
ncbi:alpha/beta fold hydrolase [Pseudonocardia asaccharolytica]|uniref:Hydrolase n=1 Tax=Pseudonocardia asaccharolytica DSM 44247 = NBRC 16224 TaxID=1123024 RepID=A0A511D5T4_9PSEU|nr:alpha/beta hydrolase [Pseudonocardia asaccharolytica]GEL20151.1 hydrolase [Pseudonocardia asaccharolytica DSM 44247 = NBRC 16224]